MKDITKCEACSRRVSWIGLAAGVLLAAFKITIGFLGRSRALIASGMCNLSDISSAFMVLTGVRYSKKRPDRNYQYGYGKVEFIVQIGMSMFMLLGNFVLLLSSFIVIAKRTIIIPHIVVLFTAVISAIVNGLIYKFASCGARELNSPALRAHAEHNKIDVASSVLVTVGVLAARVGLHWADPLIAIFECIHVMHGSWIIFWDGFKGVMDTSLPEEYVNTIRGSILEIEDIKNVKKIRARQAGQRIFLDIAIQLDESLSVLQSKRVSQELKAHLRKRDRHLTDIFVEVVPA